MENKIFQKREDIINHCKNQENINNYIKGNINKDSYSFLHSKKNHNNKLIYNKNYASLLEDSEPDPQEYQRFHQNNPNKKKNISFDLNTNKQKKKNNNNINKKKIINNNNIDKGNNKKLLE